MVRLKVLSGKKAGTEMAARHFPFTVGRSATDALSLDEPGVWEKHFQISLGDAREFILKTAPETSVTIAGKTTQLAALRNGDVIEVGRAKILFGFYPNRQKNLAWREWLTWIALAALCATQIILIYHFIH